MHLLLIWNMSLRIQKSIERLSLRRGARETVENKTLGIRVFYHLTFKHRNRKAIRYEFTFVHKGLRLLTQFSRVLDVVAKNITCTEMHKAVALQEYFGLSTFTGSGRTK
jgi:hypothetical protein